MSEILFRSLADGTADEMRRAFAHFYPVEGNNCIPEALTCTYLAYQLRHHGFFVYPEIQHSERINEHLDFAAVHPENQMTIVGEAKRVNSSRKARELGRDWMRLRKASITSDRRRLHSETTFIACLVATCWVPTYRDWWLDQKRLTLPKGKRDSADWAELKDALDLATINIGVQVPLPFDWQDQLWLLFSFIPIQKKQQEVTNSQSANV